LSTAWSSRPGIGTTATAGIVTDGTGIAGIIITAIAGAYAMDICTGATGMLTVMAIGMHGATGTELSAQSHVR
jgi:hypothetical protein